MDNTENNINQIKVNKLKKLVVTPYEDSPWFKGKPIKREEVRKAISEGKFREKPITPWKNRTHEELMNSRAYHIQRIAYFVVHGWSDAISLDVGIPSLSYWPLEVIQDGNHRFAAAIYRKDKTIMAICAGEEEEIEALL